jgi:hypothetical protein
MINVLANKLPSLPEGKNLIWKNSDDNLYAKFSQYDKPNNTLPVLKNAPIIQDIQEVSTISTDVPKINKIPKVLKVSPIKIDNDNSKYLINTEVPNIPKKLNPIKETKKNIKKPNPIDTILMESSTCEIYKSDVKDKIITLITSNEFSKVFGITKSSEIMSGIVNERVNKSIALFISFLFDKCVIYNDKEYIFNKNKETIGTIKI